MKEKVSKGRFYSNLTLLKSLKVALIGAEVFCWGRKINLITRS